MKYYLTRIIHDDEGASMVEYALLVILIAIVALVAVKVTGSSLSSTYGDIADSFPG